MIIDTLANADTYHFIHPLFFQGVRFLREFNEGTADGRYDLDGDRLFALVQRYQTKGAAEKKFESHRRYADVQYVVRGRECLWYSPLEKLTSVTDYDEERDFALYRDSAVATQLHLSPGGFAVFLPQDGHKPGCISGETGPVIKIVLKLQLQGG